MKFSTSGSGRGAPDAGPTSANPTTVLGGATWQLTGQSVRGAAHVRANRPNQDAIAWKAVGDDATAPAAAGLIEAPAIVAAVADGHGGERHPRSEWGAQFGVEVAVETLERFVREQQGKSLSSLRAAAKKKLPRKIARGWRDRVDAHAGNERGPERYVPYGATLVAVAVTERYVLYLQLGDGDILTVLPDGQVNRPIPRTQPAGRKETSSLCQDICEGLFRVVVDPIADAGARAPESGALPAPSLVMLATDGCANGFASEYEFQDVGRDLWQMAEQHGLESVRQRLDSWLAETSQAGGGDDVTVAVVRRVPPLIGIEEAAAAAPGISASLPAMPAMPPALPPALPPSLTVKVRRLQRALAASLGLWLATVIVGLATLPEGGNRPSEPTAPQGPLVSPVQSLPASPPPPGQSAPLAPGSRPAPTAPGSAVPTSVSMRTPPASPAASRSVRRPDSRSRRLSRARARARTAAAVQTATRPALRARKPRTQR